MIETEYRAWSIVRKKMCEVIVWHFESDPAPIYLHIDNSPTNDNFWSNTLESKVMQRTGMVIKKKYNIYQGDIVKISNWQETWKHGEPDFNWRIFQVIKNGHVWAFENKAIYSPMTAYDRHTLEEYNIQIIGNIYENPELLVNIK